MEHQSAEHDTYKDAWRCEVAQWGIAPAITLGHALEQGLQSSDSGPARPEHDDAVGRTLKTSQFLTA